MYNLCVIFLNEVLKIYETRTVNLIFAVNALLRIEDMSDGDYGAVEVHRFKHLKMCKT